jgi:glycosyltransferase involved in cell wall biosynthesis
MRITYVIPFFAPAWGFGGPPRVVYDMARHLVARGHQVEVLTTDALDADRRLRDGPEIMDGVLVHRDRNLNNRWAWRYKAFLPLDFGHTFDKHIAQSDVVHLFDFRTLQNAIASRALFGHANAPPYIVSAFGELPRASGIKRPVKVVYDAIFGYRLLHRAARVVAQTVEEADEYLQFGCSASQIRQLPLAVSLEGLKLAPAPGTFRDRLGISPKAQVILFLGRIHQYKGIELLIRAFATISESRPDARLVIGGRDDGFLGTARVLASRLVSSDRVLFASGIYGVDRFTAYRDADIFAMTPTHAEQTSLAALEACAVGTPVVLTEQAPIPGLDAAGAGLTVHAEIAALAAALVDLIDRPDRREMGRRAAALVREHHSWNSVTTILESIYADVTTEYPRASVHAG